MKEERNIKCTYQSGGAAAVAVAGFPPKKIYFMLEYIVYVFCVHTIIKAQPKNNILVWA